MTQLRSNVYYFFMSFKTFTKTTSTSMLNDSTYLLIVNNNDFIESFNMKQSCSTYLLIINWIKFRESVFIGFP